MVEMQAGAASDRYVHYMIAPAVWKKKGIEGRVKNSEYLYFPIEPWDDSRETYTSVREFVVVRVK